MFLLLALGLGLRLMDLTDAPLDYHPVRQLRGALISRAMYYSMAAPQGSAAAVEAQQLAGALEPLEPPLLEGLVAIGEVIAGGEALWIARILNALFWLLSAVVLLRLTTEMGLRDGGIVGLAYFAVFPLGVWVTRSFQPDALMLLGLLLLAYSLWRWSRNSTWAWSLGVGLAAGVTILLKARIAVMVLGMVVVVLLSSRGLRRTILDLRSWLIGVILLGIPALYYVLLTPGSTAQNIQTFSGSVLWLLAQPWFYVRWMGFLDRLFSLPLIFASALGVFLVTGTRRWLLLGLWLGFVGYAVSVPYTIYTHDYYDFPLLLPLTLSLAAVFETVLGHLAGLPGRWRMAVLLLGTIAIFYPSWVVRSALLGNDYRKETLGWVKLGRELPQDGSIIGFTHDYGYRLAYYGWRQVAVWPATYDRQAAELQGHAPPESVDQEFAMYSSGYRYFLVTDFTEWDARPDLRAYIEQRFPVAMQGDGYILYDLSPTG